MKNQSLFLLIYLLIFFIIFQQYANQLEYKYGFIYSHDEKKPFLVPNHYQQINKKLWVDKNQSVTFSQDKSICFIGFAIDITNPDLNLESIANNLAKQLKISELDFYKAESNLCSRYICFYEKPNGDTLILTDTGSMRQVFYEKNAMMLTSHAHLLAVNLKKSNVTFKRKQFCFDKIPGNKTIFENVFQLIPNHSLKIGIGETKRFFPHENRKKTTKNEIENFIISTISKILLALKKHKKKTIIICVNCRL